MGRRVTYAVDRQIGSETNHALWRPRSREAAIEKAREASKHHEGRFLVWEFHPVEAGAMSYRHGDCLGVFENGVAFRREGK